jgi:hypothetical protein
MVVFDHKKTMVLQTVAELGMVVFDNQSTSYRPESYLGMIVFVHKKTMVLQTVAELGMVSLVIRELLTYGVVSECSRLG